MKIFLRKEWWKLLAPFFLLAWAWADFRVPKAEERIAAAGSLVGLDERERRAFTAGEYFQEKRVPRGSDWLATHKEEGQTYSQYLSSGANRPGRGGRDTLYLLPLGEFPEERSPSLNSLREHMSLYYAPMKVKILPVISSDEVSVAKRGNRQQGTEQWHTGAVLSWLKKRLPDDCYGLLAVTMTDLYPGEGWNFVFGQAAYRDRVGIFSFARFEPVSEAQEERQKAILRRACKVLTHEMGHMFGIKHCIYYECNMNGANSLREMDSTPMNLCPVCLRKLQRAIGFTPSSRYQGLERFFRELNFVEEAAWLQKRRVWVDQ